MSVAINCVFYKVSISCAVFIIRFSEEMYQFVEGVGSAEVCLVGEGELAQQAMASLSSPPQGSATGEPIM